MTCLGTLKASSFASKNQNASPMIMSEMYIRPLGIPMIIIYCAFSGLASVYNEWILKKHYNKSLHLQNIFLYSYGTILNLISLTTTSQTVYLFHDFSFYTWLIVLTQVMNGLSMSVIIKHSSNIVRLFVISFSLIVTALLSWTIFHVTFNIYFFISFITLTCSLTVYHSY